MLASTSHPLAKYKVSKGWTSDLYRYANFVHTAHNRAWRPVGEYILIPKTGCTTLRGLFWAHKFLARNKIVPVIRRQSFLFSSVRHPLSRFVSGVGHLVAPRQFQNHCWHIRPGRLFYKLCEDYKSITETLNNEGQVTEATIDLVLGLLPRWVENLALNGKEMVEIYGHNAKPESFINESIHNYQSLSVIEEDESWIHRFHMEPMHLMSQMFFLNSYPPSVLSKGNHPSSFTLDMVLRMEYLEEGLREAMDRFPEQFGFLRDLNIPQSNVGEGRSSKKEEVMFSCATAWRLYEYFKQDFVCLGYAMPEACLKEECKR